MPKRKLQANYVAVRQMSSCSESTPTNRPLRRPSSCRTSRKSKQPHPIATHRVLFVLLFGHTHNWQTQNAERKVQHPLLVRPWTRRTPQVMVWFIRSCFYLVRTLFSCDMLQPLDVCLFIEGTHCSPCGFQLRQCDFSRPYNERRGKTARPNGSYNRVQVREIACWITVT